MGLYEQLSEIDVYGPVAHLGIKPDPDGIYRLPMKDDINNTQVNIWVKHCGSEDYTPRKCYFWHTYLFGCYNIIPRGCRACWKVVLHIKTLKRLMEIMEMQKGMIYNCKCGLENRPYTGKVGSYGAYWYGRLSQGLEGGRKMYRYVKKHLLEGEKIILKRGCTEMENRFHPSDLWDKLAEKANWNFREDLITTRYEFQGEPAKHQPTSAKNKIIQGWIEFAFEHSKATGDFSYRDYKEHEFVPDPMLYYGSIHNENDLPDSKYEPLKDMKHETRTEGDKTISLL